MIMKQFYLSFNDTYMFIVIKFIFLKLLYHNHYLQLKKREPTQTPYMLVAAIDFGTTFSGYAFSFKEDKNHPESIKMNKNWGANVGFQSYKTPTCVLLDSNKEFDSFGFEAQKKYADMEDEDVHKYYFFEKFKMKLHETKVKKTLSCLLQLLLQ